MFIMPGARDKEIFRVPNLNCTHDQVPNTGQAIFDPMRNRETHGEQGYSPYSMLSTLLILAVCGRCDNIIINLVKCLACPVSGKSWLQIQSGTQILSLSHPNNFLTKINATNTM